MSVHIVCDKCEKRLKVPESEVGHAIKCPDCGGVFEATSERVLPDDEGEETGAVEKPKKGKGRTSWAVTLPLLFLSLSAAGLAALWTIGFSYLDEAARPGETSLAGAPAVAAAKNLLSQAVAAQPRRPGPLSSYCGRRGRERPWPARYRLAGHSTGSAPPCGTR